MKRIFIALWATTFSIICFANHARAASAAGYKSYVTTGDFEDVLFELNNAIIDRGLTVDYTGHLRSMLERTSDTVSTGTPAGEKTPYVEAKYLQFCSAKLTHEAVRVDPINIVRLCPYVVFIFELKSEPGKINVGYRRPVPGPSKPTQEAFAKVEALLDGIAKQATR